MWCTIPASPIFRRLVALSAGLLVAILLAMLVGALPMAHATHEPVCKDDENDDRHATNTPTPENDVIEGTDGNDVLVGGWGDDVINGKGGFDVLCGNEGNDRIRGGGDAFGFPDVIRGGEGNDELGGGECLTRDVPSPTCPNLYTGDAGEASSGHNEVWGDEGIDIIMGARTWQALSPNLLRFSVGNPGRCRRLYWGPLKAVRARLVQSTRTQTCSGAKMVTISWLALKGKNSCSVDYEATFFTVLVVTTHCSVTKPPTVSTTPLYSTDVSQALLGKYFLGRGEPNLQTSTYKKDEQCMLVSTKHKADFSLGV